MRALPVLITGAFASVATSGLVWMAAEIEHHGSPGYEIVEDRLIITTSATPIVCRSIEQVFQANRPLDVDAETAIDQSNYHLDAEAWFSRSSFFATLRDRVARTTFSQLDRAGQTLRVELFTSPESPSFIFIDHPSREARADATRQIAGLLAASGVQSR